MITPAINHPIVIIAAVHSGGVQFGDDLNRQFVPPRHLWRGVDD
jgi:hypothetical protein